MLGPIIDSINECLISHHEHDRKGESANVVDALFAIARALDNIAATITRTAESPKIQTKITRE